MKKGMGLVEVLVGVTIITTGILSLVGIYFHYLQIMTHNTPNIQSAYLLEEGMEVTRLLRDESWSTNIASLAPEWEYHLVFNSQTSKWSIISGSEDLIDGQFDRTISARPVYRNANHNIVSSDTENAALDASTTLITAKVSWLESTGTTTKSISGYFANIFGN